MFNGIYPDKGFTIVDSLIVSLIAIVLVFLVLIIVIIFTHGIGFGMNKIEAINNIQPSIENKLLDEDPDAIIASLVATMDFHKETNKNARLISITRIDE